MEFIETEITDERAKDFIRMAQQEWPIDFKNDFAPNISDFKNDLRCILGLEDGVVLVGAFLSEKIVNAVRGESKSFTQNLKSLGFLNFTYFVVEKSNRGRGIGSLFLSYICKNYPKLWIDAVPHNFKFYEKRGFKKQVLMGVGERFIFTFSKK